ncbi:MAG: 6-carboxytetrahydropterin synthase QueD [Desulfobacterales bacterium]|nr:6-carboxytetrahydropterin synthase QueD [Desulfobacterales bacterium]
MFELKVTKEFAAAHQLEMVAKKCENLHGHNWKVEACVAGEALTGGGVLVDFVELKTQLSGILEKLDHKFLNELEFFAGKNPSSENVAVFIAQELQKIFQDSAINVSRVAVWESENCCATYLP